MIPPQKGTYILIAGTGTCHEIQVGKLGKHTFPPGFYAYVGSAHGPGGLKARVGRHIKREKTCRWHIDFLTQKTGVSRVWYHIGASRLECRWAEFLSGMGGQVPMPGFGASDCKCVSHLFYFKASPLFKAFQKKAAPFSCLQLQIP